MKQGVYAIKDTLVGFWTPFFVENDAVAQRDFSAMINSGDPRLANLIPDLELFRIGEYDSTTGTLTPCAPAFLLRGSAVFRSVAPDPDAVIDGVPGTDLEVMSDA